VGGGVAGIWLDLEHYPQLFANPWWHLGSLLLGVSLLRLVFRLSRVTGRTLARQGRVGELPRMESNRLVTSGLMVVCATPMHLGLMLFPWAVALLIGSLSFLLYIAPLEMVLMVILIFTLEEREASRKFGEEYQAYRQQVPPFKLATGLLAALSGFRYCRGSLR